MPHRSSKSNSRGTKELKEVTQQQKSKIEKGMCQKRLVSVTFGTSRLTRDPQLWVWMLQKHARTANSMPPKDTACHN